MNETRSVNVETGYWMCPSEPPGVEIGTVWFKTFNDKPPEKWAYKETGWVKVEETKETRFDKCYNYDAMLKEINERGERIKKLGEEVKLAWFEAAGTYHCDDGEFLWNTSRAKRVSEGLE